MRTLRDQGRHRREGYPLDGDVSSSKAVAVAAGGFTHDRPMRCRVLPMAAPPACRFRLPARAEAISHALRTGLKSSRCQMRLRGVSEETCSVLSAQARLSPLPARWR